MMKQHSNPRLILIVAIALFGCAGHVMADDAAVPTALAIRGKLILDDDGSQDRGGDTIAHFNVFSQTRRSLIRPTSRGIGTA